MNYLLKLYQTLHPVRTLLLTSVGIVPHACRHQPTCSQHARQAISRYGTIRGSVLAFKRLLSCHS